MRIKNLARKLQMKPDGLWLWAYGVLPTLILVGCVWAWWARLPVLREIQARVFDGYMLKAPRKYDPSAPVRIIDLDDASLSKVGQWPWPRYKLAKLVTRLNELGVGVIAFDVVFAEPDRTSPSRVANDLLREDKYRFSRDLLKSLPDNDVVFAKAIREATVVAGFSTQYIENNASPRRKAVITEFLETSALSGVDLSDVEGNRAGNLEIEGDDPLDYIDETYSGAVINIPEIENAAAGNGSFTASIDRDGIIRSVPLVYDLRGKMYPSLALEVMRLAIGVKIIKVVTASKGALGISRVELGPIPLPEGKVGDLKIPTDYRGHVYLHDTGYRPERFIPAWKIMEDEAYVQLDPQEYQGIVALVGTSAAGLKDVRATPLQEAGAGVEVHAQILEQIMLQSYIKRPEWGAHLEVLFLILLGVAVIGLTSRLGAAWCALVAGGGIAGAFGASWYGYTVKGMLLDPVTPALAVLLIYLSSSLINYMRSESEKKQIRGAFSRYMSPALVDQLAKDSSKLELGGVTREMTLMFSDIRGFTTISEQFDAQGLTQFINAYLTPMTNIVLEHKGTIDKYMGDCIMAFWNAPLDDQKHAENACRSALNMRIRLLALNKEWAQKAEAEGRKYIPIYAGIGLNSGPCCVGNMGSDLRQEYSVLGDDVNLASRLEGQSKSYGVDIVIGDNTRKHVPNFASVELDLIKVKGKTVPVHIFTLLGDETLAGTERFKKLSESHAAMIAAYRAQDWDKAEALIDALRYMDFPLEKLYDIYSDRIVACRAHPPCENWDGVFTATSK